MSWNLNEAIDYYKTQGAPREQSTLISLLREVQQENGGTIPQDMPQTIADACGIKVGVLLALIRRIPSLRLDTSNCLEMCGGPNCGKHLALVSFAEKLQKDQGNFTLKFVPCMRLCGKGPNVRWNGVVYHGATEELLRELTK